jgi:hypothetical protein
MQPDKMKGVGGMIAIAKFHPAVERPLLNIQPCLQMIPQPLLPYRLGCCRQAEKKCRKNERFFQVRSRLLGLTAFAFKNS